MSKSDLAAALAEGDLEAIRASLDAGADVRYVRPHNYTAAIDAVYGRAIETEDELIQILKLLADHGADLDAESDYGESALSVTSRLGQFAAVRLLLEAGADSAPLGWTPLHQAVALGSTADVRARIEAGDDLAARDCWDRTPWLLSLQTGDVAKAELLLGAGADVADRGRCGKTPLVYPIEGGHVEMLRWLLALGIDPNETDDFGSTPLIEAAGHAATDCVRLLLEAGADVHHRTGTNDLAIGSAWNLETVRLLVAAGADFNGINDTMRAVLTRLPNDESIHCTPAEYHATKHRVFGTANPDRMNFPFWQAMVRGGAPAYRARELFDEDRLDGEAVWCFQRFGKSITELPDGRIVEIAGEHEDFYDPDFCIYNDVFVHHGDGTFDIYGYPEDVFPPTDFHTATLAGRFIYIIGSVGYKGTRRSGITPVYRLSVDTWAIETVETTGDVPGWISSHKAKLVGERIEVSGGKVRWFAAGEERCEDNLARYVLDLTKGSWSRATEDELIQSR